MICKLLQITLLLLFANIAHADSTIEINAPWIRSAPPSVSVMAGYLNLSNHSHQAVTVDAVSSPQFHSIELHRTKLQNGMMHMQQIERLTLESGDTIAFEPGGYHLMLMDPHQPLTRGKTAELIFKFSNGEKITATANVQDMAPSAIDMNH